MTSRFFVLAAAGLAVTLCACGPKKDSAPEYVLSFDLYENGISGSLKLDYGAFSLAAQLTQLDLLPSAPCAK